MRVLINNFDGLGSVDYTSCVQFGKGAVVQRLLNAASTCRLSLLLQGGLARPALKARVVVQSASGVFLFTGYLLEPAAGLALGTGSSGGVEETVIEAMSDEALLDQSVWTAGTTELSGTAAQNWNTLGSLSATMGLQLNLADGNAAASRVALAGGSRWSTLAAALASSTRSTYRVLDGVVSVSPAGTRVHSLTPNDSRVQFVSVPLKDLEWLANDITLAGHEEPDAYVTELFQGDGATSTFSLSQVPFHLRAAQATSILDLFQGTSISTELWTVNDAGGHISLTAGGLTCAGGSGRADESYISSVQTIEMGGSLLLEARGVQLASGSVGVLLGLYTGQVLATNCFAGFRVDSKQGVTTLSAFINGAACGASFTPAIGHLYTLRLRVYSPEVERVRQTYYYPSSSGTAATGGDTVLSAGQLGLEIQDVTNGALSQAVVMYSGLLPTIPPACVLGLLSSGSLTCSVKSVRCTQSDPVQVLLGASGSPQTPATLGAAAEGAACHLTNVGELVFYPASLPTNGALITACYRNSKLAIARRVQVRGGPIVLSWTGGVLHPPAWSSVDCENAAKALLGFGASGRVALKGYYTTQQLFADDLWPGDCLQIWPQQNGLPEQVLLRSVKVDVLDAEAEIVVYKAEFADDRAQTLSFHLSPHLPSTSTVPQKTRLDTSSVNLSSLSIRDITSTSLTLSAGLDAPINGGFEVRRRDETFGPGLDSDLVLRTSATTFSIPRTYAMEQFFVRMYDGSDPPRYSAQSAAVFVNVPL